MGWLLEIGEFLLRIIEDHWLKIVFAIAFLVFLLFFLYVLHAIIGRGIFMRHLKGVAKRHRFAIISCRSSFASLFCRAGKPDIRIKHPDGVFCVFFCPGNVRRKNVYVFDDTKLYYSTVKAHSFWGNRAWGFSPSFVSVEETNQKVVTLSLTRMKGERCVLLLEPRPIGLFVYCGNGYRKSGSGERVGDLLIYEGADWIRYLVRNC